jgi:hypothetical protein
MLKSFIIIFALSLTSGLGLAEKATFDLATYTVPAGWKTITHSADAVVYAITNPQKGTYGQVAIYKSMNSLGSVQLDFAAEWQDLVAKTYKVTTKPETKLSQPEGGWEAKSGVASFDFNGGPSIAMMVTMSGFGKRMSIVVSTNTQDYQSNIESFLGSVELKKTPKISGQVPGKTNVAATISATQGFAFATTHFDDGCVATQQED